MQLTSANLNTNNTIFIDRLTTNNVTINSQAIAISGTPIINDSSITIGGVSVTPTAISTPLIFIGGASYGSESTMGIVNAQFFTANGTWTKPPTANNADPRNQVFIMMWGGGGGGSTSNRGAGGGACIISQFPLSAFNATETVTVGSGGTAGVDGGNTVFRNLIAYGGGAGIGTNAGGGGGTFAAGNTTVGGGPLAGTVSTFGGGNPSSGAGGESVFGGGGGGGTTSGRSIYGAAGGVAGAAVATSIFGGNGANSTVAATIPGGGGSGSAANINGSRGEVRVWVIGPGPI